MIRSGHTWCEMAHKDPQESRIDYRCRLQHTALVLVLAMLWWVYSCSRALCCSGRTLQPLFNWLCCLRFVVEIACKLKCIKTESKTFQSYAVSYWQHTRASLIECDKSRPNRVRFRLYTLLPLWSELFILFPSYSFVNQHSNHPSLKLIASETFSFSNLPK